MPEPTLLYGRLRKAIGGCNLVRMDEPLRRIAERHPEVRVHLNDGPIGLNVYRPQERKLFIWQRPIVRWPADAALLKGLLEHGYLIVHELDDWPEHPGYEDNAYIGFRAVHAVQVSTPAIADFVRRMNPSVAIFPNQIAALPPPRRPSGREEVVLFFGALNRTADAGSILPALNRVLAAHPQVRVDVLHDEAFFQALETPRKTFAPLCPYDEYRRVLGNADIAVLPLDDTPFNRAKSDLKFLEASAHGVAALASPVVYGGTVVDGETALLFTDEAGFERQLVRLIRDPALRARLGAAAHAYVAGNRLLDMHVDTRWAWYEELFARHETLTASLLARSPELRGLREPAR